LTSRGVAVINAAPGEHGLPPMSSICVDGTGQRSVVSINDGAVRADASQVDHAALVRGASIVLIDGHHPSLARAAVDAAVRNAVPVLLDAGSWKPVLAEVLARVDIAACSADFRVPEALAVPGDVAGNDARLASSLLARGVGAVVVTHGGDPARWWDESGHGQVSAVPVATGEAPTETVGAGDVFHGALAMARSVGMGLGEAIAAAHAVAAIRCRHVGLRAWLEDPELILRRQRLAQPSNERIGS
jgi:sugar/nucleoside kinase (ribokinase family)